MTSILGISAFYHDSAAALVIDGEIIAAAQEERFTRKKHDQSYPANAVNYVLKSSEKKLSEIDYIVFYEKPFLKFERLLETYVAFAPKGFKSFCMAMPIWLREKLFQKNMLYEHLKQHDSGFKDISKILFSEHHFSHAASAFYPSPFEEAVVLTLDGVGEWATTTVGIGKGNDLNIVKEIHFPHSIGLLYSAFTYYTGFKVNSGEYKVMGLAPYGDPKFKNLILEKLLDLKEDGTFRLNMEYFNYATGFTMTNKKFSDLFGQPVRKPDVDLLTQFHMDIAASIQAVIEEIVIRLTRSLVKEYKVNNLCMAGGVALNCVANGKLLKNNIIKNIWIQPAAGDAGGSLGAALAIWYKELKNKRKIVFPDGMKGSYLGPEYSQEDINFRLKKLGAVFETFTKKQIIEMTAKALSEEKAIGWFQGRMEFGPRALGSRSIIADPRSKSMQKNLNLKVKYRESFRPFAPSVLREDVDKYFNFNNDSPYMLLVEDINSTIRKEMTEDEKRLFGIDKLNVIRSNIPAVTHIDYSARIQTVHEKTNKKYYDLIKKFKEITGCSVILNTSFNIRGEPIVATPEDAFRCFMGTEMDILVCGDNFLRKKDQDSKILKDYKIDYNLD